MHSTVGVHAKGSTSRAPDLPRKLSRGSSGALQLSRCVSSPCQNAKLAPRSGDDAGPSSPTCLFGRANPFDTDFNVKELVAQGGFGKVYKCKSAIDGRWYAVKLEQFWFKPQAYFNPSEVRDVLLNEALALARLDHENVCRYFATWVQGSLVSADTGGQATRRVSDDDSESESPNGLRAAAVRPFPVDTSSVDDSWSKLPSMDSGYDGASDDSESSEELPGFDALGFDLDVTSNGQADSWPHAPDVSGAGFASTAVMKRAGAARPRSSIHVAPGDASAHGSLYTQIDVYIQMALYEGNTLLHWMERRAGVDAADNLAIFRQIVAGLAYIHKERIIHRDIKPANLFLTRDACVKIGDFGLAKNSLQSSLHLRAHRYLSDVEPTDVKDELLDDAEDEQTEGVSAGVGTALYSSPEQTRGSSVATSAADVFSLGVVLCELFCVFSTQMERHVVLAKARVGQLPTALETEHPEVAKLIRAMVHADPAQRPTCAEIEQLGILSCRNAIYREPAASGIELTQAGAPEESSRSAAELVLVLQHLDALEQQQSQLLSHLADAASHLSLSMQQRRRSSTGWREAGSSATAPLSPRAGLALDHTFDLMRMQEWIQSVRELGEQRRETLARALKSAPFGS